MALSGKARGSAGTGWRAMFPGVATAAGTLRLAAGGTGGGGGTGGTACPLRVGMRGTAVMLLPQRGQNLACGGFARPQVGQITGLCPKECPCDDCISDSFLPDYKA